jgi:hypothetical protein
LASVSLAQNNPFCQSDYVTVENEINIPTRITKSDNMLILTFPLQEITVLFAYYVIFGFE